MTLSIEIGALEDGKVISARQKKIEKMGLTVQAITPKLVDELDLKVKNGVVVTNVFPGSVASLEGIGRGAVILQVDHKRVSTVEEFQRLVDRSSVDNNVLLLIDYNGSSRDVVLSWA